MFKLKKISKTYSSGFVRYQALENISLEVNEGDFIAISGPSGSGKTTLMNIIGMMDLPTEGEYIFDKHDVIDLANNVKSRIRNEIMGFVFQSFNLLENLTVMDNILLPTLYDRKKIKKTKPKERALKIAKFLGISGKLKRYPKQLSGGENQRVAIARALINEPKLLLADEPTGNLDTGNSEELMKIFQKLNKQGTSIIIVTHNLGIVDFAKEHLILKDGILEKA